MSLMLPEGTFFTEKLRFNLWQRNYGNHSFIHFVLLHPTKGTAWNRTQDLIAVKWKCCTNHYRTKTGGGMSLVTISSVKITVTVDTPCNRRTLMMEKAMRWKRRMIEPRVKHEQTDHSTWWFRYCAEMCFLIHKCFSYYFFLLLPIIS